jgi:hypothetical protein
MVEEPERLAEVPEVADPVAEAAGQGEEQEALAEAAAVEFQAVEVLAVLRELPQVENE